MYNTKSYWSMLFECYFVFFCWGNQIESKQKSMHCKTWTMEKWNRKLDSTCTIECSHVQSLKNIFSISYFIFPCSSSRQLLFFLWIFQSNGFWIWTTNRKVTIRKFFLICSRSLSLFMVFLCQLLCYIWVGNLLISFVLFVTPFSIVCVYNRLFYYIMLRLHFVVLLFSSDFRFYYSLAYNSFAMHISMFKSFASSDLMSTYYRNLRKVCDHSHLFGNSLFIDFLISMTPIYSFFSIKM